MDKLSIPRILHASVTRWRQNFWYLTVLALIVEAPLILGEIVLLGSTGETLRTDDDFEVRALSVPMLIWAIMTHHFISGVIETVEAAERLGHERPT